MATALFPGTFDPLTLGHLDVLRRGCALFDEVIVAVGARLDKRTVFDADERVALVAEAVRDLDGVTAKPFTGLLARFAADVGATVLLRGARNAIDFSYEAQMAHTNRKLNEDLETVVLVADPASAHISSTLVREVWNAGGDVTAFVPECVARALAAKRA